jgi:hypothetical protein
MKVYKTFFLFPILLLVITGFTVQENNVDGLSIKFRKVSEDYLKPGIPNGKYLVAPIEASQGMKFVKLKLTLKNEGQKDCVFDFADVYISTEKDSLYRFLEFQQYFVGTKTKIKPQKEIKRIVLFEFPEKEKPKELFIEDKRYKIQEKEE